MPKTLPAEEFLTRAEGGPIIDVRTPAEYAQGHIPGAVNIPLFSNAERAEIGTVYTQEGRRPAVSLGLRRVGPRLERLAEALLAEAGGSERPLRLHCWRGGMRSASMAWLVASNYGCPVSTLRGGYKAYRRWVFESFSLPREIRVLSGLTGTGKTDILKCLATRGEAVIDLEGLAHHKGSAFGALGERPQPTQAQFENELAAAWRATDPARPVWLEDESRTVGRCVLPPDVWEQKTAGHFHVVNIPEDLRVARLCRDYGAFGAEALAAGVRNIQPRLGIERANRAVEAVEAGDLATACRHILYYYDRAYQKGLVGHPREQVTIHSFEHADPEQIAERLLLKRAQQACAPTSPLHKP